MSECLLEIIKICCSVLTTETSYSPVFLPNMAYISRHDIKPFHFPITAGTRLGRKSSKRGSQRGSGASFIR